MNWRALALPLVAVIVGAGAGATTALSSACRPKVYVEYDEETLRMRPVVRPGDRLVFKTPVNWLIASRNPCASQVNDPSGGIVECKIASNLRKREFPYDCAKVDCDPEVAVDENPGTLIPPAIATGGGAVGSSAIASSLTASATEIIYLTCGSSKIDISHANLLNAEGTVQWKSPDEEVEEWTVDLDSDTLCSEKRTTFKKNETCTIQRVDPVGYTARGKCGGNAWEGRAIVTPTK